MSDPALEIEVEKTNHRNRQETLESPQVAAAIAKAQELAQQIHDIPIFGELAEGITKESEAWLIMITGRDTQGNFYASMPERTPAAWETFVEGKKLRLRSALEASKIIIPLIEPELAPLVDIIKIDQVDGRGKITLDTQQSQQKLSQLITEGLAPALEKKGQAKLAQGLASLATQIKDMDSKAFIALVNLVNKKINSQPLSPEDIKAQQNLVQGLKGFFAPKQTHA